MSYKREGREFEHYNSQAALFGQSVTEMIRILDLCGGHPSNVRLLSGDLYVTVFGGRTRKIGTLLGTGMSYDEAMEVLSGVTLESIVIATRTAPGFPHISILQASTSFILTKLTLGINEISVFVITPVISVALQSMNVDEVPIFSALHRKYWWVACPIIY